MARGAIIRLLAPFPSCLFRVRVTVVDTYQAGVYSSRSTNRWSRFACMFEGRVDSRTKPAIAEATKQERKTLRYMSFFRIIRLFRLLRVLRLAKVKAAIGT